MKTSIEKQRDLLMGNASVDVLGMIGSTAMLGGAVVTADTKQQKEAITLDLGIPLLSSMAFSIIAGVNNIAGPVGAIIGLCFGQIVSMSAKSFESIFEKTKNNNDLQNQDKV